jgi:ketosteroid isomerase-like protein
MFPDKPEDWPRVFVQYLNAGDLNAVMALYEPEARFVTKSGEILIDRDRIRKVVGGLIEAKARLHSRVVKAVTVGDIAQLYTDFEGTLNDESGKSVAIRNKAIEVLRRQPDGTWKLIVGDPNGRESTTSTRVEAVSPF